MKKNQLFERLCKFVSKRLAFVFNKVNLEWDKDLEEAIEFTRMRVSPREVIIFAWSMGLLLILITVLISGIIYLYTEINPLIIMLVGVIISLFVLYYLSEYPKIQESVWRLRALSYAPEVIAYLIIPLKQNPNLEDAVKFAAEHSRGILADDLRRSLWDVWSGKINDVGEALPLLGHKWGKHIKGFQDSLYAIRTSQIERSESRRLNALDRALDSILCSIQESFREFIEYLRLPTTVMFIGGAILPLVIIIMLPLISFIGTDIGTPLNIALLMLIMLTIIFLFSEYTLRKRPVAFPIINIPDFHPSLPRKGKMIIFGKEVSIIGISLWTSFLIISFSIPYLLGLHNKIVDKLNTLPIVIGISLGICIYLRGMSNQKKILRDFIKKTEKEMLEATFQLGNRLMSGMSAEEAMIHIAKMLQNHRSGASKIFKKAIKNIRYLNTNLEDAFFDKKMGALKDSYSSLINSIFRIFITSMKMSINSASESLITSANHIRAIQGVESNMKNKIAYTSSMMKITAMIICPAICALSIYIARVFQKTAYITNSISDSFQLALIKPPSTSPEILQLILGIYMIALLFILIRYTSILENGDDTVIVQYEVSRAIPVALFIFLAVIFLSSIFI